MKTNADAEVSTDSYTSNIPKCIPDGEYLLRIQQLGLHNPGAPPQVGTLIIIDAGIRIMSDTLT